MAIAFVKSTGKVQENPAGTTWVASFATLPSAGNLIVVYVWGWDDPGTWSVSSCADNQSNTYTKAISPTERNQMNAAIFYAYNIGTPSGTFTVTVTNSEAIEPMIGVVCEYSGILTTDPIDKTNSNTGDSTTPTPGSTGVLTQADELVCALHANTVLGDVVITTPTDYTSRAQETDNASFQAGEAIDRIVSATTAQNPQWTLDDSNQWIACIATFKAAAVAGGARISTLGLMSAG